MTIGEVSEKYKISQTTLRYYEKVGVIPKVNRTKGGIRNYSDEDVKCLELALYMRNSELSVSAIIEYIRLFREGDSTIPERVALLKQQRMLLLEQRREMDEALHRLNCKIESYEEEQSYPVHHGKRQDDVVKTSCRKARD